MVSINKNRKVAVCSMYANPLHRGHIEYIKRTRDLVGPKGKVIVILNSDHQAVGKHGHCFMPIEDRKAVVEGLQWVDEVVESIDTDGSVIETMRMLCSRPPGERPTHFTNAGDQTNEGIPERGVCIANHVQLVDGLGDKVQSSRWLISAAVEAAARAKKSLDASALAS